MDFGVDPSIGKIASWSNGARGILDFGLKISD